MNDQYPIHSESSLVFWLTNKTKEFLTDQGSYLELKKLAEEDWKPLADPRDHPGLLLIGYTFLHAIAFTGVLQTHMVYGMELDDGTVLTDPAGWRDFAERIRRQGVYWKGSLKPYDTRGGQG